jgi:hypothetical protein
VAGQTRSFAPTGAFGQVGALALKCHELTYPCVFRMTKHRQNSVHPLRLGLPIFFSHLRLRANQFKYQYRADIRKDLLAGGIFSHGIHRRTGAAENVH